MDSTRETYGERDRTSKFKKPPIVEAAFYIWWDPFEGVKSRDHIDFRYESIPADFYSEIKEDYGYIDEQGQPISFHPFPLHRFRRASDEFPVIQIASDRLSIHFDNTNFANRTNFLDTCKIIVGKFFRKFDFIRPTGLKLSYLDAFELSEEQNIHHFLGEKLNIELKFDQSVYDRVDKENQEFNANPVDIKIKNTFDIMEPGGTFSCGIENGRKDETNERVVLLDTSITSEDSDVHFLREKPLVGLGKWLESAEEFIYDWFYAMINNYSELFEENQEER